MSTSDAAELAQGLAAMERVTVDDLVALQRESAADAQILRDMLRS